MRIGFYHSEPDSPYTCTYIHEYSTHSTSMNITIHNDLYSLSPSYNTLLYHHISQKQKYLKKLRIHVTSTLYHILHSKHLFSPHYISMNISSFIDLRILIWWYNTPLSHNNSQCFIQTQTHLTATHQTYYFTRTYTYIHQHPTYSTSMNITIYNDLYSLSPSYNTLLYHHISQKQKYLKST